MKIIYPSIPLLILSTVFNINAATQSVIVDNLWKTDSSGAKINVCLVAQNSSIETQTIKAALNESWAFYAKITFNFDPVIKANGSSYPCDGTFPGVVISLADSQPHSQVGVFYSDAPKSDSALWLSGKIPRAVRMTLNKNLVSYPKPDQGQSSNNLNGSDKEKIFKQAAIHEFGHALGFEHEQYYPAALENLDNACIDHINAHEQKGFETGVKPKGSRTQGAYSRLSIMHYDCPTDAGNSANGVYDVQTALGPTDIATIRILYGVRNPAEFPKAQWGNETKIDNGLEEVELNGREDLGELKFKLGGGNHGVINSKYYTKSKNISENIIPIKGAIQGRPSFGMFLSNRLSENGLPIFEAHSLDDALIIPIEVAFREVNLGSYPGYYITLKSLDPVYNMVSLYLDYKQKFSTHGQKDIMAYAEIPWLAHDEFRFFEHRELPHTTIAHFYAASYPYTSQPNGYSVWIPKGFGSFDASKNEFYMEYDSRPQENNWMLMPNGKFRINSNYTLISLGLSVWKGSGPYYDLQVKNSLNLNLPYTPASNQTYSTTITRSRSDMAWIYAGKTKSGQHVRSFRIAKTEVTLVDYYLMVGRRPTSPPFNPNLPVTNVTFYDMLIYCNKRSETESLSPVYEFSNPSFDSNGSCVGMANLSENISRNGYRLPSADEWEVAFRAGTTTDYPWGNLGSAATPLNGWYNVNSNSQPQAVGQKRPNKYGLYDMFGNVSEWTSSTRGEPPSASTLRCAMGGHYQNGEMGDNSILATNHYFACGAPNTKWPFVGFRVARNAYQFNPLLGFLTE